MLCHSGFAFYSICQLLACNELNPESRKIVETERNGFARALHDYCQAMRGATGPLVFAELLAAAQIYWHVAQKLRYFRLLAKVLILLAIRPSSR